MFRAAGVGSEIGNVLAIELVAAQGTRMDFERKALAGLLYGGEDGQAEIQGRHAAGIETAASAGGTVARERLKRPFRIVGTIAGAHESQAYPPWAM